MLYFIFVAYLSLALSVVYITRQTERKIGYEVAGLVLFPIYVWYLSGVYCFALVTSQSQQAVRKNFEYQALMNGFLLFAIALGPLSLLFAVVYLAYRHITS